MPTKNRFYNIALCILLTSTFLSGCVTNRELGYNTRELFTKYEAGDRWKTLIDDEVVAFGKSTTPIPNQSQDALVIAGKKYSYVINEGGSGFLQLIHQLNPEKIHFYQDLTLMLPDENSTTFTGFLGFSYKPDAGILNKKEAALYQKYGEKPFSDDTIKALAPNRYFFALPFKGVIYPAASNINNFQLLSKHYPIKVQYYQNGMKKLTLST